MQAIKNRTARRKLGSGDLDTPKSCTKLCAEVLRKYAQKFCTHLPWQRPVPLPPEAPQLPSD